MTASPGPWALVAAAACAATMGFAIQRGGTCTVAAVEELVLERTGWRLAALMEAALWVGGGLLAASVWRIGGDWPAPYSTTAWTLAGGALLGLGAFVNGACVFGAVARLGSGQWVYAATPAGFFIGCWLVGRVVAGPGPMRLGPTSPGMSVVLAGALGFALFVAARLGRPVARQRLRALACVWSPHAATTVIGLAFLALLLLVGDWSYTDALAEAAHGSGGPLGARLLLLTSLVCGALFGGWTAGRFAPARPSSAQLGRCLAGGALMGAGSLLVPGGNDALVLVGMPLMQPYAWIAFASMCATVALALRLARPRRTPVNA